MRVQPAGPKAQAAAIKAAAVAVENEKEETMRILSQTELRSCTRGELSALLNSIAKQLPGLPANSAALRTAHENLQNIRRTLSAPAPGSGPR